MKQKLVLRFIKRKIIVRVRILGLCVVVCCAQNCSLDYPPEDQISDPNAITSILMAQRALAAAYHSYNEHNYAFETTILSDDLRPTAFLIRNIPLQKLYYWSEEELLYFAENIWTSNYKTIALLNVLLERLPSVSAVSDSDLNQLRQIKAQASYLKGLCYFELLKYFSPSPTSADSESYGILLKNNFTKTENQQRITLSESFKEIDLLLSESVSITSGNAWITHEAAQYLRAELALWNADYVKCLQIALPLYEKYKQVLSQESSVSLWKNNNSLLRLFYTDIKNSSTALFTELEYDKNLGEYFSVNPNIVYENSDVRQGVYSVASTLQTDNEGKPLYLLGKYNLQRKTEANTNYYNVVRLSGLVFLCAEAYLKTGEKQKAVDMVNSFLQIREGKVRLSMTSDTQTILNQLLVEKQKEFVGERHRFFDLKRNQLPIERYSTSGVLNSIPANDFRWTLPIPPSEVKYNTEIKQNRNWDIFVAGK